MGMALPEFEVLARHMFSERWPGKSWDGFGVSRSYWRRKAKALLTPAAQPEERT